MLLCAKRTPSSFWSPLSMCSSSMSLVSLTLSSSSSEPFQTKVEAWFQDLLKSAPPELKNGFFVSYLEFYDLQHSLQWGTTTRILSFCHPFYPVSSLRLVIFSSSSCHLVILSSFPPYFSSSLFLLPYHGTFPGTMVAIAVAMAIAFGVLFLATQVIWNIFDLWAQQKEIKLLNIISIQGALRRPMTYENHPSHPSDI